MKKHTLRLFALSALSLAMVACSSIPPEAQSVVAVPNLPMDKSFGVLDDQTTSTTEQASVASVRWQDFYADDKLKALIELGLNNNKDLRGAILAIDSAKAQYQIADAKSLPSVGASGSANRSGGSNFDKNSSSRYSVGLAMASYELDFWGKVANQKESALYDFLSVNANKDTVQIALIANIAKSYVNLSYAMAQRQLALETLKTRQESLNITKERFKAGVDAKVPSLQAEASLEGAKLAIYTADTDILKARNALQLLLGAPLPDKLMPEMAVGEITTQKLFHAGLPSELLYYRPDIVSAEHALKKAGANINVARASYFPSISLSGNLGFGSSSLSDLFKTGGFSWSLGPSVSLPIFDAGQRRASYEVAQVGQKQALNSYEKAIQTAFKEVNDVLATRATIEHQLQSQYKLQANFQETYNIAHARFRSGLDNYLSVLDAERSLFSNQQNILQLELQKLTSQIELYKALGGGATLTAEQITQLQKQREAMQVAQVATKEQVESVQNAQVVSDEQKQIVRIVQPKGVVEQTRTEPLTESQTPADEPTSTDEAQTEAGAVSEVRQTVITPSVDTNEPKTPTSE